MLKTTFTLRMDRFVPAAETLPSDAKMIHWAPGHVYKYRDPKSGLYWNGKFPTKFCHDISAFFDTNGQVFLSQDGQAMGLKYEVIRGERGFLPAIELVSFRVAIVEEAISNHEDNPRQKILIAWHLRSGAFSTQKSGSKVNFINTVLERPDWEEYRYLIERSQQKADKWQIEGFCGLYSNAKSKRRMLAAKTMTDVVYARLGCDGENFRVFDLKTAKQIDDFS